MTLDCTDDLRESISHALAAHEVWHAPRENLREAAVAIVVLDEAHGAELEGLPQHLEWSNRAALLLTRRSATLNHHPGQWALPGGRLDAGETAETTALRELDEEVGLRLPASAILGRLDDFVTRSGFIMTPIVVWGGAHCVLNAHAGEVASMHRIPVDEFLRADAPVLEQIAESERPVLRMPVGTSWIAAPTAALLFQFREVALLKRSTRVAHYEQPVFAWR